MIHFILTRFNLRLWPKDKNGARIDRAAWLDGRMELFEKYCFPSVNRQSCKEFRWVLMLDDTTPERILTQLGSLKDKCPQMEILKVPVQYSTHFAEFFRHFVERESEGEEKVITTYLDNDDALSRDFVERIQAEAAGCGKRTVLTFAEGFQYFTEMRIATRVAYPNNHFISLVEGRDGLKTVYGLGSHYLLKAGSDLDVRSVDGLCWVEVVHSDNVDNDVKMTLKTGLVRDADGFVRSFGEGFAFAARPRIVLLRKWVPRASGQVLRRLKYKVKPRDWWGE